MAMVSAAAIPLAAEGRKKGAVTTEDMDTWGAYTAAEDFMADVVTMADTVTTGHATMAEASV